jgi:hypothetical protein
MVPGAQSETGSRVKGDPDSFVTELSSKLETVTSDWPSVTMKCGAPPEDELLPEPDELLEVELPELDDDELLELADPLELPELLELLADTPLEEVELPDDEELLDEDDEEL